MPIDAVQADLFAAPLPSLPATLPEGVTFWPGAAGDHLLLAALAVLDAAPPRRMVTQGGGQIGAMMSSCGALGWISDANGYRYSPIDPSSGRPWPTIPLELAAFATDMAARAGFAGFHPDACLLNLYQPGTGMGLHRDRDEVDFSQPIVSLSFGATARLRFGGRRRADPVQEIALGHGDVLIFGGAARLFYHGVAALRPGAAVASTHLGPQRLNLTFRRAG